MESLHYLLMKTHSMLSRGILSEAAKIGLTPGQPKILEFLLAKTEADQKTIAAYCEIEPATVGSILLRMEDAGLVVRRRMRQPALTLCIFDRKRPTGSSLNGAYF